MNPHLDGITPCVESKQGQVIDEAGVPWCSILFPYTDVHGAPATGIQGRNISAISFLRLVSEEKPPVASGTAHFICGWGAVLGAQRGHTAMNIRESVLHKCISQHTDNPKKEGALWETNNIEKQYPRCTRTGMEHICFFISQSVLALPLTLCGRWLWHQEQLEAFPAQARSAGLQQSVSLGQ